MKRRTILRQLGVGGLLGVGGCVDTPSAESRSSATSTTPPRERLQRHISLAREESVPDKCPVRVETEVLKSTITDTHTARIRVTITNDGPAREISVSTGGCSLFNRWSQTSQPRGLWLGFADEPQYVTKQGPQWVADPPRKGVPGLWLCWPNICVRRVGSQRVRYLSRWSRWRISGVRNLSIRGRIYHLEIRRAEHRRVNFIRICIDTRKSKLYPLFLRLC